MNGSSSTANPVGFAVCITGVPGVGKTRTLATLAARSLGVEHLVGSSVLRSVIAPASTAEFDQWPPVRRDEARARAIGRLHQLRAACPGKLLVDGHFSLRERGTRRLHRVFTPADIDFYDAVVLIDAPPEQIQTWRAGDSRTRPAESIAEIDEHRRFEREQGVEVAAMMGVPLLILESIDLGDRLAVMQGLLDAMRGRS